MISNGQMKKENTVKCKDLIIKLVKQTKPYIKLVT